MVTMISIVFGLLAWGLPLVMLVRGLAHQLYNNATKTMSHVLLSMTACGFAIWAQYAEQLQRLNTADYSAMHDIMPTSVNAALLLLIITIILNSLVILLFSSNR